MLKLCRVTLSVYRPGRRVLRNSDTGAERAAVTNDSGTYVFQPEIALVIPTDVQKISPRVFQMKHSFIKSRSAYRRF